MSSVTISPSSGNAPFPTQGGVGASPGFDAIDFRRYWGRGLRPGVLSAGAFAVSETAGGASMAVDVAADAGAALVEGGSVADQGLYDVAPHSAVATLALSAADATNPRVDRILLVVLDDEHDGSGFTLAAVQDYTGTPTSGATLDNRNGATAPPDSGILLAEVLVPAGATSVTAANIRDYRTHGGLTPSIGDLKACAGSDPGAGWRAADGSLVRREVYAELFAEIGTTWGAGDGSTTFALPDLRGRTVIGAGAGASLTARTLGQSGGAETHQLTSGEMPAHSHSVKTRGGSSGTSGADGYISPWQYSASADGAYSLDGTDNAGSSLAHPNMQPWAAATMAVYTGVVA